MLACNQGSSKSKKSDKRTLLETAEVCSDYPSEIDSLNLQSLFDSARWYIYTWQCDLPYISKKDTLRQRTFAELELVFSRLTIDSDTLELNFDFIDNRAPVLSTSMKNYTELLTGVGFNVKSHQKIYMSSPNGFTMTTKGGMSRFEQPLQPEVIKYIAEKWGNLNPCFRYLTDKQRLKNSK